MLSLPFTLDQVSVKTSFAIDGVIYADLSQKRLMVQAKEVLVSCKLLLEKL